MKIFIYYCLFSLQIFFNNNYLLSNFVSYQGGKAVYINYSLFFIWTFIFSVCASNLDFISCFSISSHQYITANIFLALVSHFFIFRLVMFLYLYILMSIFQRSGLCAPICFIMVMRIPSILLTWQVKVLFLLSIYLKKMGSMSRIYYMHYLRERRYGR